MTDHRTTADRISEVEQRADDHDAQLLTDLMNQDPTPSVQRIRESHGRGHDCGGYRHKFLA